MATAVSTDVDDGWQSSDQSFIMLMNLGGLFDASMWLTQCSLHTSGVLIHGHWFCLSLPVEPKTISVEMPANMDSLGLCFALGSGLSLGGPTAVVASAGPYKLSTASSIVCIQPVEELK